jgi:DNA-binding GntR family transcriptional regulator
MYELRALLEGYAARRAATRITAADVERLRESCTRFEALGAASEETLQALVDENLMFHNLVLEAAGSDRLSELVRKVVELPLVYKSYVWYSPSQKRRSEQAHFQLTAALANRDADQAELVMRAHVYEARDVLVEHVKAEAESQAEGVSDHE